VVLVALLWLVVFGVLVGWGLLVQLALAKLGGIRGAATMFHTMWLGYAGLLALLLASSLVAPITRAILPIAIAPALAGLVLERRVAIDRLRGAFRDRRRAIVVAVLVAIVVLITAYLACDRVVAYDTYLYHLQALKWLTSYRAIPGLANLHGRLGYDNSVLLFGGFVDAFWQGVAVHAMNGFLIAAVLVQWLLEIVRARTPSGRVRQVYCLLTLPFVVGKLWSPDLASLSTDLPAAWFALVLGLELLGLPAARRERTYAPLATVLALGAVAMTTKLVDMPLFVVAIVAAAIALGRGASRRTWVVMFALPALTVALWLVRNAIETGWLVFPVFGDLSLPWSVPRDVGRDHLAWIESWARLPQQQPHDVLGHGFKHWFAPWFDGFRGTHELELFVVAMLLFAWRVASTPVRATSARFGEWAAYAGCALAIAQWFEGAPDLRFGGFLFWMLPACLLAARLAPAMRDATPRTLVVVLALGLCAWNGALTPRLDANPPRWLHRPVAPDRVPIDWSETGPGTLVSHPVRGDWCGDEALPCTPYPNAQALRDPACDSFVGGWRPGPGF
jgi:hypothetical protein